MWLKKKTNAFHRAGHLLSHARLVGESVSVLAPLLFGHQTSVVARLRS